MGCNTLSVLYPICINRYKSRILIHFCSNPKECFLPVANYDLTTHELRNLHLTGFLHRGDDECLYTSILRFCDAYGLWD